MLKTIPPAVAGAIGPVADLEAHFDRGNELVLVGRVSQALKPDRETSRALTERDDWPDVAVFGDERDPHIASRAKKRSPLCFNQWCEWLIFLQDAMLRNIACVASATATLRSVTNLTAST